MGILRQLPRALTTQLVDLHRWWIHGKLSGIVGEVWIVCQTMRRTSAWFAGPYGWELADPQPYAELLRCGGRLGFFVPEIAGREPVPPHLHASVMSELSSLRAVDISATAPLEAGIKPAGG